MCRCMFQYVYMYMYAYAYMCVYVCFHVKSVIRPQMGRYKIYDYVLTLQLSLANNIKIATFTSLESGSFPLHDITVMLRVS